MTSLCDLSISSTNVAQEERIKHETPPRGLFDFPEYGLLIVINGHTSNFCSGNKCVSVTKQISTFNNNQFLMRSLFRISYWPLMFQKQIRRLKLLKSLVTPSPSLKKATVVFCSNRLGPCQQVDGHLSTQLAEDHHQ